MKKQISLISFILLLCIATLVAQREAPDPYVKLPAEEKIALYFNHYKSGFGVVDETYASGAENAANDFLALKSSTQLVFDFDVNVIPFVKEYVKEADFFHYKVNQEPTDITLLLAARIIKALHTYEDEIYRNDAYVINPYDLKEEDIQWFIDEYKQKIDEYILVLQEIDNTVLYAEVMILNISNWNQEIYGHPNFYQQGREINLVTVQEYYQERLGIGYIPITVDGYEE